MKITLDMDSKLYKHHNFEKKNLISNDDGSDTYHCLDCGIIGKRRMLAGNLYFAKVSKEKLECCDGTKGVVEIDNNPKVDYVKVGCKVKVIMDTHLDAFNTVNGDILEGVERPMGEPIVENGIWVINTPKFDKPFVVLEGEYEVLNEN